MDTLTDDEINEHNLRHLAQCDDRVTLSAMVQAHHVEAAAWAVAEIDRLRQQLADVTAELEAARAAASAEATFADEMKAERDRLRAELLQQPPTLEWLREKFGSQPEITIGSTGYETYRWTCGIRYHTAYRRVTGVTGLTLETRAAVLAAVAETKGSSDGA